MVVLRTLVLRCTEFIAISMGVVTNRSTSSALLPFHCEMTTICVLVTSGKASIGICRKAMTPAMTRIPTHRKVNILFFRENAMIFLMNLFML